MVGSGLGAAREAAGLPAARPEPACFSPRFMCGRDAAGCPRSGRRARSNRGKHAKKGAEAPSPTRADWTRPDTRTGSPADSPSSRTGAVPGAERPTRRPPGAPRPRPGDGPRGPGRERPGPRPPAGTRRSGPAPNRDRDDGPATARRQQGTADAATGTAHRRATSKHTQRTPRRAPEQPKRRPGPANEQPPPAGHPAQGQPSRPGRGRRSRAVQTLPPSGARHASRAGPKRGKPPPDRVCPRTPSLSRRATGTASSRNGERR